MKKLITPLSLLMLVLTACSPAAPQYRIEVSEATVRLLSGSMPAAGYMLIKNTGTANDRLIGITCDSAQQLMLHQSSVDANGVASMKMVTAIDIAAGQQVKLEPGGYHIMMSALKDDLKAGDIVTFTLQFEQAGEISVPAQVIGQ